MKNIFAQTPPIDIVTDQTSLKNWRFFGDEMEVLGSRLDAARESLSRAKSDWARWYWQEAVDRLMLQWTSLPVLHDADAQMTILPKWTIDYEYWDDDRYGFKYGIDDVLFEKIFGKPNLDESWNRARDERIVKCNCQ